MLTKEIIRKNFSKSAAYYDKYAVVQNYSASELLRKNNLTKVNNIIDIGCGTGNYTQLLIEKFPEAKIKALDISEEMIKIAKEKISNNSIEFIVGDAEDVELPEKFDLISSNASFQWFDNLDKVLAKYKNMLREKGVILFSIYGPKTYYELDNSLKDLFKKDVSIVSHNFLNAERLNEILNGHFNEVLVEEELYEEENISMHQLLNKIKYTGTRGSSIESNKLWTAGMIEKLEQIYRNKYNSLTSTHQIFYCRGVK